MTTANTPLVEVRDLGVRFRGRGSAVAAVRGVSFDILPGQCVAIVGESGSGKSVTARSLVGLAGRNAKVSASTLRIDGADARGFTEQQWRRVRGGRIGFVLQDALTSLDPLRRVGAEIAEPLRTHRVVPRERVTDRVRELLDAVGVPEPEVRAGQYPHQLSGGLRQRALIASAIAAEPALLIADEPTTALDVTVQAQILELFNARKQAGTALLLISHDLAVVAQVADHLLVMKDGEFVEQGCPEQVLDQPEHPYTRRLLAAVPVAHAKGTRLTVGSSAAPVERVASARVVLRASNLSKSFDLPGRRTLTAVRNVTFELRAGETLGIVGESGSGKTTTGRMLLDFTRPDSGVVEVDGQAWADADAPTRRALRGRIQMIHQDPLSSFDPRYTAAQVMAEVLGAIGVPRADRAERAAALVTQVGLSPDKLGRRPRELSGGERQRLAIARALAPDPSVIVCDEPVSALDVSIQAQVLDLLAELQERLGVGYVFVSHHLGVIYHVSDRVLVMKDGETVEAGPVEDVFAHPEHDYTRKLMAAVPRLDSAALRPLVAELNG
jgi:peptide/nickel transport system ATP-binding protein